jgi:polyribonucleotide nucleotidyltransferase
MIPADCPYTILWFLVLESNGSHQWQLCAGTLSLMDACIQMIQQFGIAMGLITDGDRFAVFI